MTTSSCSETDRSFNALMPILARRNRPIALLGMMGAGKSTMARQVAGLLGMGYADADREINKWTIRNTGMDIPYFFAEYGEDTFRKIETEIITEQLEHGAQFLALGGGAFINPHLRTLLLEKADCVYLDVPKEILWGRIKHQIAKRPMLDTDDPRATFDALYTARAPIYAEAPIHVHVTSNQQIDTLMLVKEALWTHVECDLS